MSQWRKDYAFLLKEWRGIVSIFVFFFNTETSTLLLKFFFGLSGLHLKIPICILAVSETIWWYYFAHWAIPKIEETKTAKEGLSIVRDAISEAKKSRLRGRVIYWVKNHILDQFDSEKKEKKVIWILKFFGKYVGILLLFFLGFVPGIEIFGILVLQRKKWNAGFAALLAGNVVKNIGLTTLLDYIWHFFK